MTGLLTAVLMSVLTWFDGSGPLTVSVSDKAAPVVGVARTMMGDDLKAVTGKEVRLVRGDNADATVMCVQLDRDRSQDKWLKSAGVPVDSIRGIRECFMIKALDRGNGKAQLIVVGSDGRGTAYGLLEVSRMAGVSPWIWWGDVVPEHKGRLVVDADFQTVQSPSVEYRGIFINDEDWTLQSWAWKHFDKQKPGMMSVNVYREVFKLLLRLRGNMIWPGMHGITVPFYKVPGAKECADSCGIVIGTSHCEPLMRNNVGEWNVDERGRYNYITNRDNVLKYWTERLKEAGQYENFYTIGMRGIHDGEMEGVKKMSEKVTALNNVIKDQRELLKKYVVGRGKLGYKHVEDIPQAFVPYKEVLQVMEAGVDVPDDVTLIWCDDNYGYMTRLSDAMQQKRKGGAGVYYHLSYWGRPMDYMWLTTTQPGLIYSEMRQAYDHNARKEWIVNVHDLKAPAYDLEVFMDLAWNVERTSAVNTHLHNYLSREYGLSAAQALLPLMLEYYRLTAIRKPEFMGWNQVELSRDLYPRGRSQVKDTEFSFSEFGGEAQRYLADYQKIRHEAERIGRELIPARLKDAYFASVLYPVSCAAYMAEKMLYAQKARSMADGDYDGTKLDKRSESLRMCCARSQYAYQKIRELTAYYNDEMSDGRWKGMMCADPRDLYQFWSPNLPVLLSDDEVKQYMQGAKDEEPDSDFGEGFVAKNAVDYEESGQISTIENLGHSQKAVVLPKGEVVKYAFEADGKHTDAELTVALIPTQANDKGDIRFAVSVDSGEDTVVSIKEPFRSDRWKENVLRGQARCKIPLQGLTAGRHTFTVKALDDHIILDQWIVDYKKDRKYYVIPVKR